MSKDRAPSDPVANETAGKQPGLVDMRSDFLTRPTPAMVDAMVRAGLGEASFGLREDPGQIRLEQDLAALLGMADALLFPTCSMANEVALMLLAAPGDVVLAQPDIHVITSEAGAPAALAGVHLRPVGGDGHFPQAGEWAALAQPSGDPLRPRIAAIALENTHNRAGGLPWPVAHADEVLAVASRYRLRAHLDGARLFNAAVALQVEPSRLCAGFDTVAVSLNKGLGAPVGAMLAGSADLIERALVLRQRLGGGIRPTAMIAAAAREALTDWSHLAEDHRRARLLAQGLVGVAGLHVDLAAVQTNIVLVDLEGDADQTCVALKRNGLLALPTGERRLRLVTYRGITDSDISRAVVAFKRAFDGVSQQDQEF